MVGRNGAFSNEFLEILGASQTAAGRCAWPPVLAARGFGNLQMTSRTSYILAVLVVLGALAALAGVRGLTGYPKAEAPSEQESSDLVRASIRGLCSQDPLDHAQAKAEVILSEPAASPDLLSTLGYLVTGDGVQYPDGRDLMDSPRCGSPSMVVDDICEILSRANCKEAVPLMVKAMPIELSPSSWAPWNPPAEALVKFGPYSAPYVLDSINNSQSVALSRAVAEAPFDAHEQDRLAKEYEYRIKVSGALVLGKIGGADAFEALERLRNEAQPSYLYPYLDYAIKEIRLRLSGG